MQDQRITISTGSIFKILAIGLTIYIVYLVWNLILILFVALIFAALIDPFAAWFQKKKIPRALAVLVIYILVFSILAAAIALLAPVIARDVPQFVGNMEQLWADAQSNPVLQRITDAVTQVQGAISQIPQQSGGQATSAPVASGNVSGTLSGVFSTISGFFGGLVSLVLVLVFTFYMVAQDDPMRKIVHSIVPDEYVPYVVQLLKRMREKLGLWIRGQLILSVIIGVLVFLGLSILDVRYAPILALIAALFEFVPYVGPVGAAIPALILAFSQGGIVKMIIVGVMYIVIQQLENHILVPKVMQKAVGLNPIVSIIAILTGAKLAGVLGALIAIPVATALSVFVHDIVAYKKNAA